MEIQDLLTTDQIFEKLQEENQLQWSAVLIELVDWLETKYKDTEPDTMTESIVKDYPKFNLILNAFYSDKITQPTK